MFFSDSAFAQSNRTVFPADPESRGVCLSVLAVAAFTLASGGVLVATHMAGVPSFELLRDPADHFGIPVHAGLFSYLGVMIMSLAAGILGFATAFGPAARRVRFGLACLLTLLLALDDQFMLHEVVLPELVGVPEEALYLLYVGLILAILWTFGLGLARLRHLTLLLALMGFALVVGIDLVLPINALTLPLEDLAKLGGYAAWLCYWALAAGRAFGPQRRA